MKRLTITRVFNCGKVRVLEERHPRGTNLIKQIIKGKYEVEELENYYRERFREQAYQRLNELQNDYKRTTEGNGNKG